MNPKETLKQTRMKVCVVKYLWGVELVLRVESGRPYSRHGVALWGLFG